MSDKKKHDNGGPAYPIPNATDMDGYVFAPEASGMTLHDWYAGQALVGICAHPEGPAGNWADASCDAHRVAAAMIAEKRRREEG